MEAYKTRSLKIAFVVKEPDLRQLDQILAQTGKDRDYALTTTENTMFRCDNLEAMFQQISATKSRLTTLRLATPAHEMPRVTLTLSRAGMTYNLAGSETEVPYLDDRLEEWGATVKPWYSRLATIDIIGAFALIIAGTFLSLMMFVGCAYSYLLLSGLPLPPSKSDSGAPYSVMPAFFICAWLGMGAVLSFLRTRLFPTATFAFGQGLRQHNQLAKVRRGFTVVISVIFTLLLSLLANWLSRGWK